MQPIGQAANGQKEGVRIWMEGEWQQIGPPFEWAGRIKKKKMEGIACICGHQMFWLGFFGGGSGQGDKEREMKEIGRERRRI
jgi:hypothetical protein